METGDPMAERDDRDPPPLSAVSPSQPVGYRLARLGRLVRKELSEILRDRRTIVTLLLMPLLLYPLLSLAFQQFFLAGVARERVTEYRIGVPEGFAGRRIISHLRRPLDLRAAWLASIVAHAGAPGPGSLLAGARGTMFWLVPQPPPLAADPARPTARAQLKVGVYSEDDLKRAVHDNEVDVGIRMLAADPTPGLFGERPQAWQLLYLRDSARSREVLAHIERECAIANVLYARARLPASRVASVVHLAVLPLGESEAPAPLSLAALIPLILILMTITGAVYPAIDLTAGERERGTLEILVAAPVPRLALLFAKYVSVVTVAILTATVNLVSMTVTLELSGLGDVLFEGGLTVPVIAQVFGVLLLFAAFFSAVLLVLTSFARSFKEAQAYLIPLMLAALAPGVMGMMPGLRLTGLYAVTPLLNVVLLARDLFEGRVELGTAALVVLSTGVYALAAVALAARIFGSEGVLYNEQSGWSDMFRRPREPRPVGTVASALLCLALLFPTWFGLASLLAHAPNEARPVLQALGTVALFGLVPLLLAAWGRVEVRSAFRLRAPAWASFAGAGILGLGLCPLLYGLLVLLRRAGLTFVGAEQEETLRQAVGAWREIPAGLVVGSVALAGATEELFFRGYLFSALRAASGAAAAVFGSALLFGLFHFPSAFDRLLPSTLMGVVLGWVCLRTGSVLPGMALHACYNGLFVWLAYYPPGGDAAGNLPAEWLGGALAAAAVGAGLILAARRRDGET